MLVLTAGDPFLKNLEVWSTVICDWLSLFRSPKSYQVTLNLGFYDFAAKHYELTLTLTLTPAPNLNTTLTVTLPNPFTIEFAFF